MNKKIFLTIIILLNILNLLAQDHAADYWFINRNSMLDFSQPNDLSNYYPVIKSSDTLTNDTYSVYTDNTGQIQIYGIDNKIIFPIIKKQINLSTELNILATKKIIICAKDITDTVLFDIIILGTTTNAQTSFSLFTIDGYLDTINKVLNYTSIFIQNGLSAKMDAIELPDGTIVAMTHLLNSNEYRLFTDLPKSEFISYTSTINYTDISDPLNLGEMNFSPDGKFIATTYPSLNKTEILRYEDGSLYFVATSNHPANYAQFSSDSHILYLADSNIYNVIINPDYSVTDADTARWKLGFPVLDMQLAPDGKIYLASNRSSIYSIELPNNSSNSNCLDSMQLFYYEPTGVPVFPNISAHYLNQKAPLSITSPQINRFTNNTYNSNFENIDSLIFQFPDTNIHTTNLAINYAFPDSGFFYFKTKFYFSDASPYDSLVYQYLIYANKGTAKAVVPGDQTICDTSSENISYKIRFLKSNYTYKCTNNTYGIEYPLEQDSIFNLKQPGNYTIDFLHNNEPVYQYEFTIFYPEAFLTDPTDTNFTTEDDIHFNIYTNTIPYEINDISDNLITWDFGDDTVKQAYGLTNITHRYELPGVYTAHIYFTYNQCQQNIYKTFKINSPDTIYPNKPFLLLHDTTMCHIYTDTVQIKIKKTSYPYTIKWYFYNQHLTKLDNLTEIKATVPGTYKTELYDLQGNLHSQDTCIIKYVDSASISADLNYYIIPEQDPLSVDFSIENFQQNTLGCPDTPPYIIWDLGDANIEQGENLLNISHRYENYGVYKISVFIYDSKGYEHIINKTIKLLPYKNNDTLFIYPMQNNEGDISLPLPEDFFKIENYCSGNKKYTNVNDRLNFYAPNTIDFNFYCDTNQTLDNVENLIIGYTVASKGDFEIVYNNNGDIVPLLTDELYPQTVTLLGRPNPTFYDYSLSQPKTYLFSFGGTQDIMDRYNNNEDIYQEYLSPGNFLSTDTSFYYLRPDFYKLTDNSDKLQNKKINDIWSFGLKPLNKHGYFKSIFVEFAPKYFLYDITPDSIVCQDDYGYTYSTTNFILNIKNIAGLNDNLNCTAYYNTINYSFDFNIAVNYEENYKDYKKFYLTPNGDGYNDTWQPLSPDFANATITVFDKLGRVVAYFHPYEKPEGWDGTYKGKPLPSDSYWFIIKFDNGKIIKGIIDLIR